jgi:Transposase zinc-binding domain
VGALQKIIRVGYERLKALETKLAPHACRVIERICRCRTAALGGHIQVCPEGHVEKVWCNSCRERS